MVFPWQQKAHHVFLQQQLLYTAHVIINTTVNIPKGAKMAAENNDAGKKNGSNNQSSVSVMTNYLALEFLR